MTNEYELKTLADIYKKVPPDKWAKCLLEMNALFREWQKAEAEFSRPANVERVVWVDDEKGEIHTRVTAPILRQTLKDETVKI